MFSQELLTSGELNHFSLKERMVEIGKRWHKLNQTQKDKYKKQVEEQQLEYKAELEAWIKVGLWYKSFKTNTLSMCVFISAEDFGLCIFLFVLLFPSHFLLRSVRFIKSSPLR